MRRRIMEWWRLDTLLGTTSTRVGKSMLERCVHTFWALCSFLPVVFLDGWPMDAYNQVQSLMLTEKVLQLMKVSRIPWGIGHLSYRVSRVYETLNTATQCNIIKLSSRKERDAIKTLDSTPSVSLFFAACKMAFCPRVWNFSTAEGRSLSSF